jgi:uncharacterized protein YkwD
MSDNFALRRYHRQTLPLPAGAGKPRYLKFGLAILLLAGICGAGYLAWSSVFLAGNTDGVAREIVSRINLEREANNIEPVRVDERLNGLALSDSREVVGSVPVYSASAGSTSSVNLFVIPKISWILSGYDTRQQLLDMLENTDPAFRNNILDSDHRNIGIGVSSDGYHYYIAVRWE